jgi:APA family basic amino acid/polyamine antiporter
VRAPCCSRSCSFQAKHLIRDTVVAVLAFAYSVRAIAGAGNDIVTKGFLLLSCGIPVYVAMRWWDRRTAPAQPALPAMPVTTARFPAARKATMVGGDGAR